MYLKFIYQKDFHQTLGKFLLGQGISRQAIIESKYHGGLILVNQKRRLISYRLSYGDEIFFIASKESVNEYLKPNFEPLEIIFETDFYLIINKPSGLLSIPSRYENEDSVVNRLLGYFLKTEQKDAKPHVVTRLDQYTSGLMVVTKHSLIHGMFAELDQNSFVKKYQAIVHGTFGPNKSIDVIDAPIKKLGTSVKHGVDIKGKPAKTQYRVLKQTKNAALTELRLFTGRTHQIRVHLASIGHPLFGDSLYGLADIMHRQALHAYSLTFVDPITKETKNFQTKLPTDMMELWDRLEEDDV